MSFISVVQIIPSIFSASVFGYCNVAARIMTMTSSIIAEMEYTIPLYTVICSAFSALIVSQYIIRQLPKFRIK
jgi:hypothetical protein